MESEYNKIILGFSAIIAYSLVKRAIQRASSSFAAACEYFSKHSEQVSSSAQLSLYALFKQATAGDCILSELGNGRRAIMLEAWKSKRGMTSTAAQTEYISILDSDCPQWRTGADEFTRKPEDIEDDASERVKYRGISTWAAGSVPTDLIGSDRPADDSIAGQFCLLASEGDLGGIQQMLDSNASLINAKDSDGMSCLHWAADRGRIDVASFLLSCGADIDVQDDGGNTPLHLAAISGQQELIGVLLESGADVDIKNEDGESGSDCLSLEFPGLVI